MESIYFETQEDTQLFTKARALIGGLWRSLKAEGRQGLICKAAAARAACFCFTNLRFATGIRVFEIRFMSSRSLRFYSCLSCRYYTFSLPYDLSLAHCKDPPSPKPARPSPRTHLQLLAAKKSRVPWAFMKLRGAGRPLQRAGIMMPQRLQFCAAINDSKVHRLECTFLPHLSS
jgi:hypothetical protein